MCSEIEVTSVIHLNSVTASHAKLLSDIRELEDVLSVHYTKLNLRINDRAKVKI